MRSGVVSPHATSEEPLLAGPWIGTSQIGMWRAGDQSAHCFSALQAFLDSNLGPFFLKLNFPKFGMDSSTSIDGGRGSTSRAIKTTPAQKKVWDAVLATKNKHYKARCRSCVLSLGLEELFPHWGCRKLTDGFISGKEKPHTAHSSPRRLERAARRKLTGLCEYFLEGRGFDRFAAVPDSLMPLYDVNTGTTSSSKTTTSTANSTKLIVDLGFGSARVLPVLDGTFHYPAETRIAAHLGGCYFTKRLQEHLNLRQNGNISFTFFFSETMKQKTLRVPPKGGFSPELERRLLSPSQPCLDFSWTVHNESFASYRNAPLLRPFAPLTLGDQYFRPQQLAVGSVFGRTLGGMARNNRRAIAGRQVVSEWERRRKMSLHDAGTGYGASRVSLPGLADVVHSVLAQFPLSDRKKLVSDIQLVGGGARAPGMAGRLAEELLPLLSANSTNSQMDVASAMRITVPSHPELSAFRGLRNMVAEESSSGKSGAIIPWITKKQYEEEGAERAMKRKRRR